MYTEEQLEGMTLTQLRGEARVLNVPGRSSMEREDLIIAILAAQAAEDGQPGEDDEPREPVIVEEGMPNAQKAAIGAVVLGLLLLLIGAIVLFGMKGCDSSKISEGTFTYDEDYEPQPIVPGGGRSWADVLAYGDAHPVYWKLVKIVTRNEVDRAYVVKSLEAEQSGRNMLVILYKGTVLTNSEYLKDRDEYRVLHGYRLKKDREALIGHDGKPRILTMCLNPIDFKEGKPWTPCPVEPQKPKDKPVDKPKDKPKDQPEEPCYVPKDTNEYHTPSNPAYQPPVKIPGKSDPTPGYTPGDAEASPPQGEPGSAPPGDDTFDGGTAPPSDPDVIIVTPETGQDNEGPPPPPPPPPPAPAPSTSSLSSIEEAVITEPQEVELEHDANEGPPPPPPPPPPAP